MTKKIIILICTLYTFAINISAQPAKYNEVKSVGLIPSDIADFIRYGNSNMNFPNASGEFTFSVPIYTIKEMGIEIPIALKYSAPGFIPARHQGILGVNWHLAAGGIITREVLGVPDDMYGKNGNNPELYIPKGYYAGIKYFGKNNKRDIFEISSSLTKTAKAPAWDVIHDFEPDIFHFNFNNHSGSFIIGNDGSVKVLVAGGYKVDLSGLRDQYDVSDEEKILTSTIVIIAPDGYRYTFGGEKTSLSTTYINQEKLPKYRYITSWHLANIEAPNGEKINFHYKKISINQKYTFARKAIVGLGQLITLPGGVPSYSWGYEKFGPYNQIVSERSNIAILDSITTGLITINFKTKAHTSAFFDGDQNDILLSRIEVHAENNQRLFKRFNIDYQTYGKYCFLNKVEEEGITSYSFGYNLPCTPPSPLTYSVDHWGFWRGEYNTTVPEFVDVATEMDNMYMNGTVRFDESGNKSTVPFFSDYGLLKEIKYPTGGFTRIKYERNDYTSRIEIAAENNNELFPILMNKAGVCGGARVCELYDSLGNSKVNRRKFKYTTGNSSSGVLNKHPRYAYINTQPNMQVRMETTTSFNANSNMLEPHISYSEIAEIFDDGSYNIHKYTTHLTHPDIKDTKVKHEQLSAVVSRASNGLVKMCSMQQFRNLPLVKQSYNSSKQIVAEVINVYNEDFVNDIQSQRSYEAAIRTAGGEGQSYKVYTVPVLLKSQAETRTEANEKITKTIDYLYNPIGLVRQTKESQSDGRFLFTATSYVEDYDFIGTTDFEEANTLFMMKNRNMVGFPVEIIISHGTNEGRNRKILSASVSLYKPLTLEQQMPRIHRYYSLLKVDTTQYYPLSFLRSGELRLDPRLDLEYTCDLYDSRGNLLQITERGSKTTSYLWGYYNNYPVVKAVNTTHNQLNSLLSTQQKEDLKNYITYNNFSPIFTHLRIQLPDAQIYGYTYQPLMGIASTTKPDGLTTYYRYDKLGRLICVLNNDKHIIKTYKYHYKGQSNTIDEAEEY